MLVGTFQSIYPISAEEIDAKMQRFVADGYNIEVPYKSTCDLSYVDEQFCWHAKDERPYQKEFGFKPVWFFPAPTLADAFAHASLVGVETPWYFFVYDIPENEFLKIDGRVRANALWSYLEEVAEFVDDLHWLEHLPYRLEANPTYVNSINPLNFLTDSNDVSILDLVISDEKLSNYKPLFVFPVDQSRIDTDGEALVGDYTPKRNVRLSREYKKVKKAANEFVRHDLFAQEMYKRLEPRYRFDDYKRPWWYREGCGMRWIPFAVAVNELERKDEFVLSDLPYLWYFADAKKDGKKTDLSVSSRPKVNIDFEKFGDLRSQYLRLTAYGELTSVAYKEIYDGLKALV